MTQFAGVLSVAVVSNAFAGGMLFMDGTISTKDNLEMKPIDDAHIVIR